MATEEIKRIKIKAPASLVKRPRTEAQKKARKAYNKKLESEGKRKGDKAVPTRDELTLDRVREALIKSEFVRSDAAVMLGCTRHTVSQWIKRHPELTALDIETSAFVSECARDNIAKSIVNPDPEDRIGSQINSRWWLASRDPDFIPTLATQQNIKQEIVISITLDDELEEHRKQAEEQAIHDAHLRVINKQQGSGGDAVQQA